MLKVVYSPKALEDLQYINDFIITNWGQDIALRVLKKITAQIRRLEQYPLLMFARILVTSVMR